MELTEKELYSLGLNKDVGGLEDGHYEWWSTNIETLQVSITYEYDEQGNFIDDYVVVGDVEFYGIKKEDFIKLLEILRNGKCRN